jgi:hypothetical protein
MANMPSNQTPKFAILFGFAFIIIAVLMFIAVYNAHTIDVDWFKTYSGGVACSIIFGVLGVVFAGSGFYLIDRKPVNSSI